MYLIFSLLIFLSDERVFYGFNYNNPGNKLINTYYKTQCQIELRKYEVIFSTLEDMKYTGLILNRLLLTNNNSHQNKYSHNLTQDNLQTRY